MISGRRGCPSAYHHPPAQMESLHCGQLVPQLLPECGETAEVRITVVGLRVSIFCWCWSSGPQVSRALPPTPPDLRFCLWLCFTCFTHGFEKPWETCFVERKSVNLHGSGQGLTLYSSGRLLINFYENPTSSCLFQSFLLCC